MKNIIYIIIATVAMFVNNAQAMTGEEVAQYVLDTVPGATTDDAGFCAYAYQHDGVFVVQKFDITLKCSKHYLSKTWDQPSN